MPNLSEPVKYIKEIEIPSIFSSKFDEWWWKEEIWKFGWGFIFGMIFTAVLYFIAKAI